MLTRTEIINGLIKKHGYLSYLEIGVDNGLNFNRIQLYDKTGVDPNPVVKELVQTINTMTSDEFFKTNERKFDIIFIDGLHHAKQVYTDIVNALSVLSENGTIVCHDMNPRSFNAQKVPRMQRVWNGDCWKAFLRVRVNHDIEAYVIDTDEGCGIITKKLANKINIVRKAETDHKHYLWFVENKKELLNLISVNEYRALQKR